MFSSVRVRLTLWYTVVLACALVGLALATYFVLRRNSARLTDAALVEMADSFLTTVRAETQNASGPDSLKEAVREAIAEHKFRDTVFVVLDADDKIIAYSDSQIVPAGSSGTMPANFGRHPASEHHARLAHFGRFGCGPGVQQLRARRLLLERPKAGYSFWNRFIARRSF